MTESLFHPSQAARLQLARISHHCASAGPCRPHAASMLLSPSSRSFSSYFLRHLHPASAIFFIILLAGRGSGLSFRIPCLLCRLMKALVSFVDACVDSTLTYQNIGSVHSLVVSFGCSAAVVIALFSSSFHPFTHNPALWAGVFPCKAMCGLTKLYCILLPSASGVSFVFQPLCTFTLSRNVPFMRSILLFV